MVNANARRVVKLSVAAAVMLGSAFLGACAFKPGGSGSSDNTFTYRSTPSQPMTISVMDTRTGQAVWSGEVPVGEQLVVRFVDKSDESESKGESLMRWAYMPIGSTQVSLPNSVAVPAGSSRRVNVELRKGPEAYPEPY